MITPIADYFSKVTSLLEQLKAAPDMWYTAIYWPDVSSIVSINTESQKVFDFTFTW